MAETGTKTRKYLTPVISAAVVLGGLILIVAFWDSIERTLRDSGGDGANRILAWIPEHPKQTLVSVVALLVAFGANYIAHLAGRLRAWLFVLVIEAGVWLLFWNSVGISPLKNIFGLDDVDMSFMAQVVSGVIILALSGVIFWFLEAREAFKHRRHRLSGGEE